MVKHCITLNVHWTAPDHIWEQIAEIYRTLPYWAGYDQDGLPIWQGDGVLLEASVEPSGLQLYGDMPEVLWLSWKAELVSKLENLLGYPIGEPEEGYAFYYWPESDPQRHQSTLGDV